MCAGSLNALHAALSIAGAGPPRGALSTVSRIQKERQGQRRALPPLSEEQDGSGSPLALSLRQTPAGAVQAETAAVSRKPDDDGHAEGRAKAMPGNPHDARMARCRAKACLGGAVRAGFSSELAEGFSIHNSQSNMSDSCHGDLRTM